MILVSGGFDGLHAGHVRYLSAAMELGEYRHELVCAVAPDSYIRRAKNREPYWPQADRAETLRAVNGVRLVIRQADDSVASLIRALQPDLFVKGSDWRGKLSVDVLRACQDAKTEIRYVNTPGKHVSEARG